MATKFESNIMIDSEASLQRFCSRLAPLLTPNITIGLSGPMGAGKTTFVRHLTASIGSTDWVNSPTYSLIQHYEGPKFSIFHVDLYRCNSDYEIDQLDLPALILDGSVLIIEWIDRSTSILPTLSITFETIDQNRRMLRLSSNDLDWVSNLDDANAQ